MKKRKEEGVAEGIIREFGFGGLIDTLKKSPTFKKRFEKVNKQIEQKMRKGRSIRPHIRSKFSVRTLVPTPRIPKRAPKVKKEGKAEPLMDVFDEDDSFRIVAELPGVEENDIKVKVKGDRVTISTDHEYHKELRLPSPVKKVETSYKNGILEVKLKKVS